jgi:hypothetical protein
VNAEPTWLQDAPSIDEVEDPPPIRTLPGGWTADDMAEVDAAPRTIVERLGARGLGAIPTDPPPPLLCGRRDAGGHTILHGMGDAGKGTLASSWIVQGVAAGERFLILDYENHPDEWARRVWGLGGAAAVAGAVHVAPLTAPWRGIRGPLWVQADEIRELAESLEATYLIVDSLAVACAGADPLKPEVPAMYAAGLELIGLPVLSIAHVTKAEELRYPFGSIMWHNLSRTTWSLAKDGDHAILTNRKSNNHRPAGRFVIEVTYLDDRPAEVSERPYSAVLADQIDEVIGTEQLTAGQIVARLAEAVSDGETVPKADSVRAALRRGMTGLGRRYTVSGAGSDALYRRVEA